jgi:hypothetical protein
MIRRFITTFHLSIHLWIDLRLVQYIKLFLQLSVHPAIEVEYQFGADGSTDAVMATARTRGYLADFKLMVRRTVTGLPVSKASSR